MAAKFWFFKKLYRCPECGVEDVVREKRFDTRPESWCLRERSIRAAAPTHLCDPGRLQQIANLKATRHAAL